MICIMRLVELAAVIVPSAANFILRLADILRDILYGTVAISVSLNRRCETVGPRGQIINDVPALVLYAAVNDFERVIEQRMKMNCLVLVILGDHDISKPAPPNVIVEPDVQLFDYDIVVVPIKALLVDCECNEIGERGIARAEIENVPAGAGARFLRRFVVGFGIVCAFSVFFYGL